MENSTPSFGGFYPNLTLAAIGLSSETIKFHDKKNNYFIRTRWH